MPFFTLYVYYYAHLGSFSPYFPSVTVEGAECGLQQIAEVTELSIEEVQDLQKEIQAS
jgi:hypothetical protein